ncbi:MAG: IS1182 family transposase [Candidatus Riflebacteria bacterium]|nr:IS1182 family transposase [Candidatus Riflebacteria bacterium]
MARFKSYDYRQRLMIPVSLEDQIMYGTLEFAIQELIENRLDLSPFHEKYCNDKTGRPAINPKILLKIVLLSYSRGIVGSRRIEQACKENIVFMAMTCGYCPDHATIAEFVSGMSNQISPLFTQVLLICQEMGLLGGTYFAIDGCKLPGNASKKWSGTLKELKEKKESLEKKVDRLIQEHQELDKDLRSKNSDDEDSLDNFRKHKIEALNRQIKRINKFLDGAKPRIGKQKVELKSNVIDPDSAKMATSHGVIQGYNAQAIVDDKHQIILAGLASGEGNDNSQIPVILPILKQNLKTIGYKESDFKKATFVGDSGYFSVENLKACANEQLNTIIPDCNFRKRDPRLVEQKKYQPKGHGRYTLTQFKYEEMNDQYRCPAGKSLTSYAKQTMIHGRKCRLYVGKRETCGTCALRFQCMMKTAKRRTLAIPVQGQKLSITDAMKQKIDSEEGRKEYAKRMGTVEPVFANIRETKGLKRFTLRGKIKAGIQWLLWCMVHNIEKIGYSS